MRYKEYIKKIIKIEQILNINDFLKKVNLISFKELI